MCLKLMETTSKHMKPGCWFKNMAPGSKMKLRWRLLRVATDEDEALKHCRATAVIRKYLRRQPRRVHLAKLVKVVGVLGEKRKREAVCEESPAAARVAGHPAGAMAPENTTQYLMGNAYEDMRTNAQPAAVSHVTSAHVYDESLSPRGVYAALDSSYESSLAFQQRDFEEVCGLYWGLD